MARPRWRERAVRALGTRARVCRGRVPLRRRWYGEGPLHLLLMLGSFALTVYAGLRLLSGGDWPLVIVWFVGAALLHDLVLLPLYSLADRVVVGYTAGTARHRDWTAYVRVPAALSGLLLLVWFPLIAGSAESGSAARFEGATGLPGEGFLTRWLLLTAGLCAVSALWLLCRTVRRPRVRRIRRRRSETGQRPANGG